MKCFRCNKKAAIVDFKHLPGEMCSGCFARLIEQRVRKQMRTTDWFKAHDKILILDDGSVNASVSEYLLERILKDVPKELKVVKRLPKRVSKNVKVVVPWSIDLEVEEFLHAMFEGVNLKQEREIRLLRNVAEEEIILFAKLKKLKGKRIKATFPEIREMIAELSKTYPGARFSLLKSSKSYASDACHTVK
ncbi:hypothetical protein KY320_00335 [Candidatus Woesearchaeota archaeon]|nr:hypothetical protein [Candidatus Woesearchaeota archaeon]